MTDPTPQLDPSELYDKRKSKDASRLRAYNKILEQIYNRIRVLSKLPNSQCYLLYTVPPFILGLPKIDLEDCVIYLIYQLRHSKYDVRYTPPNMLYISWIHHEQSYIVQQSPIMAAMLESAERTQAEIERNEKEAARLLYGRKSQRKVQIQTPGSHQQNAPSQRSSLKQPQNAINTVLNRNGTAAGSTSSASSASSASSNYAGHTYLGPSSASSANHNYQNHSVAGPPPPSAADYIPPTTFLQNMTHPQNTVVQPKSIPEYLKRPIL